MLSKKRKLFYLLIVLSLVNSQYGDKAVTFVDNHDTSRGKLSPGVANYKYQAYAYILLREKGRPCIFWKDYYQQISSA